MLINPTCLRQVPSDLLFVTKEMKILAIGKFRRLQVFIRFLSLVEMKQSNFSYGWNCNTG